MNKNQGLFSRDNSLILRGVAIMFIVLHNFMHVSAFHLPKENEMSFSIDYANAFFDSLSGLYSIVGGFFSHLGWIGVPVFVFLTGYGVALREPPVNRKGVFSFIKRNYLKLLALMLPAILLFGAEDVMRGLIWPDLFKRASYLTMLANFAYPYVSCLPGVYWYFGLTFQFYLLWAIVGKKINGRNLLIWSALFILGLYLLCSLNAPNALSIYRHCFTGWFPVFALGVSLGGGFLNHDEKWKEGRFNTSVWLEIMLFVCLLGLILLMSKSMISWLFIPIIALIWFIIIGLLLMRTRFLSKTFRWIGKYSACLFVCHPIARSVVLGFIYPRLSRVSVIIVFYIVLCIVIAIGYSFVYKWLLSKMLPKRV